MAERKYGRTRLARDMRKVGDEYIGCSDAGTQVIVPASVFEVTVKTFANAKFGSWWVELHPEHVKDWYGGKIKGTAH